MVKVRKLEHVIIVFWSKEAIYVKDLDSGIWILFHRYLEVGGYNSWRRFRWNLMRIKSLTARDCHRHAYNYDIQYSVCALFETKSKLEEIVENEGEWS